MAQPSGGAIAKGFRIGLLSMCGLLIALQIVSLFAPIVGEHDWRQSDTYSVARNFHLGRSGFFHPRIDWNHGRSGVMGMEAPLYPFVSAIVMTVTGAHPATMRIIAWLAFAGGVFLFLREVAARSGGDRAVGVLVVLAVSPMILFETRQIQPDGPMLACLLVAAAFFWRYSATERVSHFALGMAAYSAGVLTKSPAIFAGPAMWLFSWVERPASWGRALARLAWFVIPAALWLAWNAWSHHLDLTYNDGIAYFATTPNWTEVRDDLIGLVNARWNFGFLLPSYVITWSFFPLCAVGAALSVRREERRRALPFWMWLLGGLPLLLLFARRFYSHWYYAIVLAPPLAWFGGIAISHLLGLLARDAAPSRNDRWAALCLVGAFAVTPLFGGAWEGGRPAAQWSTWTSGRGLMAALVLIAVTLPAAMAIKQWPRRLFAGALAVTMAVTLARAGYDAARVFTYRARFADWRNFTADYEPLREAVDCYSGADDSIVTNGASPWYLYLAQRRGFSDDGGAIVRRGLDFYRNSGARLLVRFRPFDDRLASMLHLGPPLAEGPRWELQCIAPDGCPRATRQRCVR